MLLLAASAALADKTDPSLIPPDVTLTTAAPVAAAAAPAAAAGAGATAAAGAVPGLAGAATPPAGGLGGLQSASGMTVNGYAVPKSGKITATIGQPPGTRIGSSGPADGTAQSGSGAQSNGLYQGSGVPVGENAPDPVATINTSRGTIQFRMFRKYAPKTVDNFVDLVGKGFYNGLTFHRVEPGFCIQGGCPSGTGTGIYIDPQTHVPRFLPLEVSPYLKHNTAGVVAMAHMQSLDSGSCQFYITLSAQPSLDNQYTVFGGVISGMDVVKAIQKGDKIISASVSAQ